MNLRTSDKNFLLPISDCPSSITLDAQMIMPTKGNSIHNGLTLYKSFYMELEIYLQQSNPSEYWTNLVHFRDLIDGFRTPGLTEIFFL